MRRSSEDISYIKTERALLNTFNDIEVSSMINYYGKNKDFISQRNKVIIEIFADCGLRAQEVRELKMRICLIRILNFW